MEEHDFGVLLGLAYIAFVDDLNARMRKAGFDDLGPSHGYVFRALADGPLTLSELANRLHMTTQGAGKIVDEMERGGYVRRRPDPDDGRARRIELDRRGRQALTTARKVHHEFERRLAARLGASRVKHTRAVLQGIVDAGSPDGAAPAIRPI
jgi:DNA-binding MarR family transcriptional regulator